MRPPRLRCTLFPSIYPPHLLCSYKCGSYLTLLYFANSSLRTQPYMRFLSVGPEVCLQLPSDSSSRKTPLLFSYTLPTTWVCSGLAPVRARPWRANKNKRTTISNDTLMITCNCSGQSKFTQKLLHQITLILVTGILPYVYRSSGHLPALRTEEP